MHRLIVGSATYRQSSRGTPGLYARDPYNRLLARGPRFRVEAEIVRDIALASSGLLNPKLGGPSVYAPAPGFLFLPPASYAPFPWKEETGPDRYRRAVYTFRRRSTPYPMLATFDAPNGDSSCVRRLRSNTPLQALTTLNETLFVECARALARRALEEGGRTDLERVTYAFRRVLGRAPTDEERTVLLELLAAQVRRIAEGRVNPRELAAGTDQCPDLRSERLARRAGSLHRLIPGAAEPRRDDHKGMSHAAPQPPATNSKRTPDRHHPPLVLQGMRRGPGHHGARTSCWAGMPPPDRRLRPARSYPDRRTSVPGPRASFTCSWPAGPASSSSSTTSPSWRSGAASFPRPGCCKAIARRSSPPAQRCWGPSSPSVSMGLRCRDFGAASPPGRGG